MLALHLLLRLVCAQYFPTKWDPLLAWTSAYDEIVDLDGWFSSHTRRLAVDTFGDISVITMNFYTKEMLDSTEEQIAAITAILDHSHPTVFCMQGVDDDLMKKLRHLVRESKHYKITNDVKYFTDRRNSQDYFLPIVYDEKVLEKKASNYFLTGGRKKILYGSWARFKSPKTEFTVINIDLFSSSWRVINAQFSNIVADIITDKITSSFPVIIAGGIMAMPPPVRSLLRGEYKNLIDVDSNNEHLVKTTMHARGNVDDDIQRDFIILRDKYAKMSTNYARILSEFPLIGQHFPVHAILSVKEKSQKKLKKPAHPKNASLRKLFEAQQKKFVEEALKAASQLRPVRRAPLLGA